MFARALLFIYSCLRLSALPMVIAPGTVAEGHTHCYNLNTVGASMRFAQNAPDFVSCTPGGICQYKSDWDDDRRSF